MKNLLIAFLIFISFTALAQSDSRISTLQFVQIVDNNIDEALYYYENNWKSLRELAVKKKIISSYEFMRTERSDDYPIDIILITTFKNEEQFSKRESNFEGIMLGRELKLLNDLKPGDFRKSLFVKEKSRHSFK